MSGFVISKSRIADLIAWAQSGAGAVLRTVADKFEESCSLADFASGADAVIGGAGRRLVIGGGESVTLNVPAQFPTIQAAWNAISAWVIASTGTVTIQVADGTYVHAANLTLNHPYGARIRLVGNEAAASNCTIEVSAAGFDCLAVTNGHTLGYINGFRLRKTAKAPFADNSTGLLAHGGASIFCGPKIEVDNWYYGIAARNGSYISCPYAKVDHAGDVGIWAFVGSTVDAANAQSNNTADVPNGWGFGFQAEYSSALNCSGASATGCNIGGIASLSNSNVRALGATANNNTGSGFFARDGGTIECHNATATGNTRYGVEEIGHSRVLGNAMTLSGNTLAQTKNVAYLDNGALGARIVANGDMRIDLNGTDNWYFNSPGGAQLSIGHAAAVVSRWHITGAAAGQPVRLFPVSAAANVAAHVETKGNEVVRLMSNGKIAFQAYSASAAAVNYGQCDASVAGQPVTFSAYGDDAVIDLGLSPKGAGSYLRLGAGYVATADAPVVGYISVKDNTGTVRKLAVIA